MRRTLILCAALLPGAVQAAPATQAGADAIRDGLVQYLPPIPGVIDVRPDGETYVLTVDTSPYFSMIPPGMGSGSLSPLEYVLTDMGDGLFGVTQATSLDLSISVSGVLEMSVSVDAISANGVFDTAISAYRELDYSATGITLSQDMNDPTTGQKSSATGTLAQVAFTQTGAADGSGGTDINQTYSVTGYEVSAAQDTPMGPIAYTMTLPKGSGAVEIDSMRGGDVLGLVAWLFARPAPAMIMAEQDELKSMIGTALPIFDQITALGAYEDVIVDVEGFGQAGADRMAIDVELAGAVAEGHLRERISVEGLRLPDGIMPPWAAAMVPSDVGLNFEVTGFDLAAPAAMLLDRLDFATGPDAALEAALAEAVLPNDTLTISLLPERIAGDGYFADYSMTMEVDPTEETMPFGAGRVVIGGFDQLLALANGAPDQVKQGMVPGMMMARGMAQAGDDDTVVWDLEFTQDQKLLVNGQDLSPLLGR